MSSLIHPIRDSGVNAIESLMERRGAFDYILLETTGLADPGNIAPLFWVDKGLGSTIYLDGVVTLVDAKNILRTLDDRVAVPGESDDDSQKSATMTTAHLQISHADLLIINKTDLITLLELETVTKRIRAINGLAKLCVTRHGWVQHLEGFLLNMHAYDKVDSLDIIGTSQSVLDPVRQLFFFPHRSAKPNSNTVPDNLYPLPPSAGPKLSSTETPRRMAPFCSLVVHLTPIFFHFYNHNQVQRIRNPPSQRPFANDRRLYKIHSSRPRRIRDYRW